MALGTAIANPVDAIVKFIIISKCNLAGSVALSPRGSAIIETIGTYLESNSLEQLI